MRASRLASAVFFAALSAKHYPLPSDAIIHLNGPKNIVAGDPKGSSVDAELDCTRFTRSERSIRRMFRVFRELSEGDNFLEVYNRFPCAMEGTIQVGGKNFYWELNEGNWIDTNYPDGKDKALGGDPDKEPAD